MPHIISYRFSVVLNDENKVAVNAKARSIAEGLAAWLVGNKILSPSIDITTLLGVIELPPPVTADSLIVPPPGTVVPEPKSGKRLG